LALFNDLPVYKATYDLLLAIFGFTKDFSKDYKYTVGENKKTTPKSGLNSCSVALPVLSTNFLMEDLIAIKNVSP